MASNKKTYKEQMLDAINHNRHMVLAYTHATDGQYADAYTDFGREFLERNTPAGMRKKLDDSGLFWNWWSRQYNKVDEDWV